MDSDWMPADDLTFRSRRPAGRQPRDGQSQARQSPRRAGPEGEEAPAPDWGPERATAQGPGRGAGRSEAAAGSFSRPDAPFPGSARPPRPAQDPLGTRPAAQRAPDPAPPRSPNGAVADPAPARRAADSGLLALDPEQGRSVRTAFVDASLGSITLRLDALVGSVAMLRTVMADRLADYSNEVTRAQAVGTRDLEDYRRVHERAITEIGELLRGAEGAAARLERSVSAASATLAEMDDALGARMDAVERRLAALAEEVSGGAGADRGEAVSQRLDEMARSLGSLKRRLALRARADRPAEVALDGDAIEALAGALASRLAEQGVASPRGGAGSGGGASPRGGAGSGGGEGGDPLGAWARSRDGEPKSHVRSRRRKT